MKAHEMTRITKKIGYSLAVAIAAVGVFYYLPTQVAAMGGGSVEATANTDDPLLVEGELKDNVLGKEDAPVTVIEYSSMTCPHCSTFHKGTLPDLKKKYVDTGKVRYILREFPLDNLAAAGAMLARCASDEKYYPLVGTLYKNQEKWAFAKKPLDELEKIAKQAGFSSQAFKDCLSNQEVLNGLMAKREHASKELDVSSTPTFFINGKKLLGAQGLEKFSEIIDPMLDK
jgi:protein-disulfide isomerase